MTMTINPRDVARRYGRSEKRIRQLARELTPKRQRWNRWSWEGWNDPGLRPILDKLEQRTSGPESVEWDVVISSKNQITLPVAALQHLKAGPGQKVRAVLRGRSLLLLPHPVSWVEYYAGSAQGLYGHTKEEIDAYLREVRGAWEPHGE